MADGEGLYIPMFVFTPWAPFAYGSNPGVLIQPSQIKIKRPQGAFNFYGGW